MEGRGGGAGRAWQLPAGREGALPQRQLSGAGSPCWSCWQALKFTASLQSLAVCCHSSTSLCGRCRQEAMIWRCPPVANFGVMSDRLLKLSEPKKLPAAYYQQRSYSSTEGRVSQAALCYVASPRILELARPRVVHSEFQQPKEISKAALQAVASPRILELARPKRLHPDYKPQRDAQWPVTDAAKRAVATPRLVELAQPRKRRLEALSLINPDAFKVKESAKRAICSPRILELARPIKR